jgi:hypothetical protein
MEAKLDETTKSELRRLELLLMDPGVRRDRERVGRLLAPGFVEFGSSGRVWTREVMLELLATGTFTTPQVEDFAFRLLGQDVVLVTYRTVCTDAAGRQTATLRSSIWIRGSDRWQVCFHQGTQAS